jgi:hypothetical protein
MCRPVLVSGLLCAVLVGTAGAQGQPVWRDSVQRLSVAYRALRDSLVDTDSSVVEVSRRDGLVISASPKERATALEALEYFAARRARWFGGAVPSRAGFRIVARTTSGGSALLGPIFGDRYDGSVVLTGLPDSAGAARLDRAVRLKEVSEQLFTAYAEMMFPTLGAATGKWLKDPPPFHMTDNARRYQAMYAVMTSTGKAERGCVDGHLDFCAYAFWLRPAPSPELTGAYPRLVRADLFQAALDLGGSDAWARIVAAEPESPLAALEAAAGMPADSVIARWRTGIMTLRPDEKPLHFRGVLLAAGWTAVLLAGTLGVSRWR